MAFFPVYMYHTAMDTIPILDFGSQTTQLIARRIRDMGVYTEIIPGDSPFPPGSPD